MKAEFDWIKHYLWTRFIRLLQILFDFIKVFIIRFKQTRLEHSLLMNLKRKHFLRSRKILFSVVENNLFNFIKEIVVIVIIIRENV